MSEGKLFNCPSCGSSLSLQKSTAEIKCQYCGNTVIVPKELRPPAQQPAFDEIPGSTAGGKSSCGVLAAGLILLGIIGVVGIALTGSLTGGSKSSAVKTLASPTPTGFAHVVLTFGGEGTAPGLFQDARHVAADVNGNIYVDDYRTLRVQRFDATGKYVSGWTVDQDLCINKSATLDTLAADRSGSVFVHFCGSILKYDGATGKLLAQFSGDHNNPRNFYLTETLYPDGGLLVVASESTSKGEVESLVRLDADGKVLAHYPGVISAQSPSASIAMNLDPVVDGLGNIFVLHTSEPAVYKISPDGKFVSKFGSVGKGIGQFDSWAKGIAVDNQSRLYVTDATGIKVFDSNGAFLEGMSDRLINGAIYEMRITDKNEMYVVGSKSMIYKLALNVK
jgi:DNA-directed RNA polymerase subunit RPC12/RpoP